MTAPTIPTSAAELEEMLLDKKRMGDVLNDGKAFGEFITNYARTVAAKDQSINDQIREGTQLAMAEFLKNSGYDPKNQNVAPINMNPVDGIQDGFKSKKGSVYNRKAPGAKLDKVYNSAGEFFQSIWHNSASLPNGLELAEKLGELKKVQNTFGSTVPADGGFLIPEVLRSEILSNSLESALVRPRATVIPMDSLRVPIPTVDETSHASSVFGGLLAYWTEEGADLVESSAKFAQVVLDAKKLTMFANVPNELVQDASAFMGFLDARLPQAIAWYEDVAFTTGNGVGQPLGFINCPASVQVAAVSGQGANTITWLNIVAMYSRMLPSSLASAVWIASIDTFPQLATMALSVGTGGSAVWLNNGVAGPPMTILGRPVHFTEKTPALGTTGDISFVDLSYYLVGDRQTVRAESSPHFKFGSDKTSFRVIERVDGRPWIQSAITPENGSSNTLTPFVQLSSTRT